MDNIPRLIFYLSTVLIVSSGFILLSSDILVKVNDGTLMGTFLLVFYGLVYFNISMVFGRRFMRRLDGPNNSPYIIAIIAFLPPAIWVLTYPNGMIYSPWPLIFVLFVGCLFGGWLAHRLGLKAQIRFQEEMKQYLDPKERQS